MCALGIIGICTALALTTMKPAEKKATKYLYMNAYNSLEKAYYNSVLIGKNPFREEPDETGNVLIHSDTEDTGTQLLCEGLTTYINTATNKKMRTTISVQPARLPSLQARWLSRKILLMIMCNL